MKNSFEYVKLSDNHCSKDFKRAKVLLTEFEQVNCNDELEDWKSHIQESGLHPELNIMFCNESFSSTKM